MGPSDKKEQRDVTGSPGEWGDVSYEGNIV